jgi:glycolate oxidase iron-sulfur subunit
MSEHVTGRPLAPVGPGLAPAAADLAAEERGLLACVHCGFCLNACPTYRRLGHEGDSPRGRLDLMRAVVEGRLPPDDPAFRLHIDQCLGCRACEPVCPSGVPYGFVLERARTAIALSTGVPLSTRLLIAAFTGRWRPLVTAASRLLRATGLARLLVRVLPAQAGALRLGLAMLAASAPYARLARSPDATVWRSQGGGIMPGRSSRPGTQTRGGAAEDIAADGVRAHAAPHALAGAFPAATGASIRKRTEGGDELPAGGGRGRVALLEGCVQSALFARVNAATVEVLEANGWEVVRVREQRCCGALDAHAGRLERAQALARRNIEAFEGAAVDRVVVNAAGCGAMLKEYGEQLKRDGEWAGRADAFTVRVRDVAELLMEHGVRRGGPLPLRVTYDAPCHLLHGQRIRNAPLDLLDSIPSLERVPLEDADECCGGAGLYGVHHPELGGRILGDKVAALRATGAAVVATPNPGCMMQIGAGLLLEGVDMGVVHPLELLAESYRRGEAR